MADFTQNLEKYADVILKVGLNFQPGQRLLIGLPNRLTPFEAAPLVRLVTERAYQMGARLVDVLWGDDQIKLARVKYAAEDTLEEFPDYLIEGGRAYIERGDARLVIYGENPDLYAGQDLARVGRLEQVMLTKLEPLIKLNPSFVTNWLIVSVPVPGWAAKLFPGLSPEAAAERMWETIFKICRIDRPDPVAAWQAHLDGLAQRSAMLNEKQYTALHYRGPGTDLRVGLPAGHLWEGGSMANKQGIVFTPNLPTEEVFTLPHRERVEGHVAATRPFSFGGGVIEGAKLTFQDGKVVQFSASNGEEVLRKVLETDENAVRLGEAALVPHSSPVSQSGLVFNNILYDENASCHFALGRAYKASLQGGVDMDDATFTAAGGNVSKVHLDFMVGSAALDVDGICADGTTEAVLRGGEWAF